MITEMPQAPEKIVQIRRWIDVCEAAGTPVPEQVHLLDAYARLLEARVYSLTSAQHAPKEDESK